MNSTLRKAAVVTATADYFKAALAPSKGAESSYREEAAAAPTRSAPPLNRCRCGSWYCGPFRCRFADPSSCTCGSPNALGLRCPVHGRIVRTPEPLFTHTEQDAGAVPVGLSEMLAANREDEDLCDWLRRAQPGGTRRVGGGAAALIEVRRVA